jgi:hypothetical protein
MEQVIAKAIIAAVILQGLATRALAADDIDALGTKAFVEACLISEPSYEKVRELTGKWGWKLSGASEDRHGSRHAEWQIASPGDSVVLFRLHSIIQPPQWDIFACTVAFANYRDRDKRIEKVFLEEIGRRPNAKVQIELGFDMDGAKRLHYKDGPAQLTYFDGLLADPSKTPWALLEINLDRLQKQ